MPQLLNITDYIGKATIGGKYQVVVTSAPRKIAKKLTPGTKVIITPLDEASVNIRAESKDWIKELYGTSKGLWEKDATKIIKTLRKEWR